MLNLTFWVKSLEINPTNLQLALLTARDPVPYYPLPSLYHHPPAPAIESAPSSSILIFHTAIAPPPIPFNPFLSAKETIVPPALLLCWAPGRYCWTLPPQQHYQLLVPMEEPRQCRWRRPGRSVLEGSAFQDRGVFFLNMYFLRIVEPGLITWSISGPFFNDQDVVIKMYGWYGLLGKSFHSSTNKAGIHLYGMPFPSSDSSEWRWVENLILLGHRLLIATHHKLNTVCIDEYINI